jgi:hypothetical protein
VRDRTLVPVLRLWRVGSMVYKPWPRCIEAVLALVAITESAILIISLIAS